MKIPRSALVPAIAVAALLVSGCRSLQRFPGQWLELPAQQGEAQDWSRRLTSHLFDNGMMAGLGNDGESLYVFFTPDSGRGLIVPGRARLRLWISAGGGRGRDLGIEHIGGGQGRRQGAEGVLPANGRERAKQAAALPGPAPAPGLLKVIDRVHDRESFIAADGSQGPALRLSDDWGEFTYQARLPLRATASWPGLAARPGSEITVGIEWKIESRGDPGRGGGEQGPGAAPGRKRGGRGMAGMPPQEGGAGARPGSAPVSKRRLWVKTRLAEK